MVTAPLVQSRTQHHMYNMHRTPYVHSTSYPTCTYHHLYTSLHIQHVHNTIWTQHRISIMDIALHMQYSHNTICTISYITLHKQHVHMLRIHNMTCTQHHRCNMYNIYNNSTSHPKHIVSTKKPCPECLIHACPNMSQTTLLSFHWCILPHYLS